MERATETPRIADEATEARFRAVADATPIGMFEADARGHARYVNPAWQQITGISAREAVDNGWHKMLHPDDAERVIAAWQNTLTTPHAYGQRFRIRVNGEDRWVDAQVAPTRDGDTLLGFVGTLADVTPIVTAEVALEDARDRALDASRLKSEFIANISHEIRTPLNGVLGLTQILAESTLDERQQSYVDTIRRAGDDLLQLLNDVLDLSKVEAGAMRTETISFEPAGLVRDTAHLFEAAARTRDLDLRVIISKQLAPLASGDPTRLRQVISNLISNAIKFTDHGGVTVTAEHEPDGPGRIRLRISVTDSGPGIPVDAHERVFEPFAQGDSSTTRRFGGSGLGLSISKRIIELMGGRLTLSSMPGSGATFTVELPLAVAEASGAADAAPEAPEAVTPLRVLVVEDNAINQLVLQTMLGRLGHSVDIADNGADAVRFEAEHPHDVILMDCQMPVMDGYAATAAIRALPGDAARTPIVALTASAMPTDKQRCIDAGMDDYLPKPVIQADLMATIARVVQPVAVSR